MDPLKTAFIDSIPIDNNDLITSALKPLGLVKWVPIQSGCGFAQFSSAAQVKAALEVLPMAGLRITVSEDTKAWISRAAFKSTVQNVTRMSPTYLTNKIKTVFKKAPHKNHDNPDNTLPKIEPDGTFEIKDPKLWDEIRQFREQSLVSKKKNIESSTQRLSDPKRARTLRPPYEGIPSASSVTASKNESSKVLERSSFAPSGSSSDNCRPQKCHTSFSEPPAPSKEPLPFSENQSPSTILSTSQSLPTRASQDSIIPQPLSPQSQQKSSEQPLSYEGQSSGVPEMSLLPSADRQSDHHQSDHQSAALDPPSANVSEQKCSLLSPSQSAQNTSRRANLKNLIPALVEEFFGIPDEDVIRTIETYISENRPETVLVAEFKDVLEDDFDRFSKEVYKLKE